MKIGELKESDKGRGVIYTAHHGEKERGVLSSWNAKYVFARFTSGSTAAACDPEQLEFEHRVYERAARKADVRKGLTMKRNTEKPTLPGYIVLARGGTANDYRGVVEHSFSLGMSAERIQFFWSSDHATSNFGGDFKVDGREMAEDAVRHFSKSHPDMTFEIFDVHDPDIPVWLDWDDWRDANERSDKTLSGVKDKFRARNVPFLTKDDEETEAA